MREPTRLSGRAIWQVWLWAWIGAGMFCASPGQAQQPAAPTPSAANQTRTNTFYQLDQVQVIALWVRDSDLDRMEAALPERVFVRAAFQWGDQTIDNVGVRFKGNSSSIPGQHHKRGFLIKFNEFIRGQTFLGLERIGLDNGVQFGSLFSEPLITSVLRDLGITAPRCNFAKLSINGWDAGVYVNVERIDTVFVGNHFADGTGPLYKVDEGGIGANWEPLPPGFRPTNHARLAFEPKSPTAWSDARDVHELITRINQPPADTFASVMETTLDVDAFLKTMAVLLYAGAFDQLTGWNPHNYYLYHEPRSDRWHYLPADLDVGFADNAFGQIPVISGWNAAWPIAGGPPRPLIESIVDDPQLLARYRHWANEILEKHFHPDVLCPKVDALYQRIQGDLASDPFPPRRITNPEDRDYASIVASIKNFIHRRYLTARAQLDNPGRARQ